MSFLATAPFAYITDSSGNPLNNGYIYFGVENQNPETNPISIYWDDALSIPAANPVRTTNGYIYRNGSPASIYTSSNYSITVKDSNGRLVYNSPSSSGVSGSASIINFSLTNQSVEVGATQQVAGMTALRTISPVANRVIYLKYHTTTGDGGHGNFRAITGAAPGTYTDNGGTIIVPTGGDGSAAWLRDYSGAVNIRWFGASPSASAATNSTAIQAAISIGLDVDLSSGTYSYNTTLLFNKRGQRIYGRGIDVTVLDYTGASDLVKLQAGQIKISDFSIDGNGTTGAIFRGDEAGSAETAGVWEFDNIRGHDAAYFASFGASGADTNQADTYFTRCTAYNLSGDFLQVNHDQGINYLVSMCTVVQVTGSVFSFVRGGRLMAIQNAYREVGTILSVQGAGENSDYFEMHGISIDGSTGTAYPQWHKLVDADSGRIVISNYSSGNSAATPTAPLITLNGFGEIKFTDSVILPVYTWNGTTGIPVVYLDGLTTNTIASFISDNIQLGSYSAGSPATYTTYIRRVDSNTYVQNTNIHSKGQRFATQPDVIIGGSVAVSGAADVSLPFFGSLTYVPVVGNYTPALLAVTLLAGSITAGQTVNVKLQRNRGGLANVATYTLDSTTTFPKFLITEGDRLSPAIDYRSGDQIRISVNDASTGATPTLGFTLGLARG